VIDESIKFNFFFLLLGRDVPLGHFVNRPPPKTQANCYFKFSKGLLYVCAKKKLYTKDQWIELYAPYNDKNI